MSAPQTVDEVIAIVRMRVAYARATGSMFPPSAIAAMADLVEAVAPPPSHDAAALRAALEKLVKAVKDYFGWEDAPAVHDIDGPDAYFCEAVSHALAALAMPARNCDRFQNALLAQHEFLRDYRNTLGLEHFDGLLRIVERVMEWSFAPATKYQPAKGIK